MDFSLGSQQPKERIRTNIILLVIDALCHPFEKTALSYDSSLKAKKKIIYSTMKNYNLSFHEGN